LSVPVLIEYLHLWELLSNVELQPEVEDTHIWKFTNSGLFSTKSAYEASWSYSVQSLGNNLEELGPGEMQILLVDSGSQ